MHLVAEVGGGQAWCCRLIAVEHYPQTVSKDVQAVACVPRARSAYHRMASAQQQENVARLRNASKSTYCMQETVYSSMCQSMQRICFDSHADTAALPCSKQYARVRILESTQVNNFVFVI